MKNSMFLRCIYGFASQWPYLSYLGIGAWWAWIWVAYSSAVLTGSNGTGDQGALTTLMYMTSTPSIAILLLVAGICWKPFTRMITKNWVCVVAGCVACAATLFIACAHDIYGQAAFVAMACLTGLGTGMLCLKCGQVYGRLAARDSLMMGFMSLVFACFLYFVVIALPQPLSVVLASILPVCAALLFIMPGDDPFPEAGWRTHANSMGRGSGAKSFRHLVIASALVVFTSNMGQGLATATLDPGDLAYIGVLSTLCIGVLALFFAVFVCGGDVVNAIRRIYSFLMLWGITIVLLSCFGLINLSYMNIGKEELWMLFSCLMAYMAFRFDFSPVQAFGIGQAVYFFSAAASWLCGVYAASWVNNTTFLNMAIGIVFAFVIVLVMSFVFTDSDIKFILTWHPKENSSQKGTYAPAAHLYTSRKHTFEQDSADVGVGKSLGAHPSQAVTIHESALHDAVSHESSSHEGTVQINLHDAINAIDPSYGLSDREVEVLELFAQGRSANWIADDLSISKNTVRSHVRSIYTKLDVHTRQDLIDFLQHNSKTSK